MQTVLVAGANGALGRAVVAAAKRRGLRVRALVRRAFSPAELGADEVALADPLRGIGLDAAFQGVERVFSALGASVLPEFGKGYRSFPSVDTPANRALIQAAQRAKVQRFVYVSVAGHEQLGHLRYVRAHEDVVATLRSSGLAYSVLRPTGFFSVFGGMLEVAQRGVIPELGVPEARTNPIADEDLAELAVAALCTPDSSPFERTVGGPHVYTRRQLAELAFRALGKEPKFRALPPSVVRALSLLIRPFNPRIADLMAFFQAVFSRDCVGEPSGQRRIEDYFAERARALIPALPERRGSAAE